MAKKRKSKKKAKSVKRSPKKSAKKAKAKPKAKPKFKPDVGPKVKKSLKMLKTHKEDFRVFLFLAAAVIILVLLARNNVEEVSSDTPIILDVTTEQVGDTDMYIFNYIVANPTPDEAQCDIVVEINEIPYRNTVIMQPGEEIEAQTEVEMPGGENSIRVYAEC